MKVIRIVGAGLALLQISPARGQEFRFAEDTAPATLNPVFVTSMVETRLHELLFSSLFKDNRLLQPQPDLADAWTIAPDKLSMEIILAERSWHDGKPVTADDVKFTIDGMKDPRTGSRERPRVSFIKAVEVLGPKKVRLEFESPVTEPLKRLYFKIIPKHHFPAVHAAGSTVIPRTGAFRTKPIGSGPFSYVSFNENEIRIRRRAPQDKEIAEMRALLAGAKATQLDMLRYNYLEAIIRVPPSAAVDVKALESSYDLLTYESLTWWFMGINHRNPHLAKKAVREAIVFALDRDKIRSAHLGDGTTISGPFAPRSPFYNYDVVPRAYDPVKSEALMTKAGYQKKDGLYVDARGREVKFDMVLNNAWKPLFKDVALSFESEMRKHGFKVFLSWKDNAAWNKSIYDKSEFDLMLHIWTFDEGSNVYPLFHSRGAFNFMGYRSKLMDDLLDQSDAVKDPDLFFAIYLRVHALAHEELPYIFLWSVPSYSAVTTKLAGVQVHPFYFFTWVDDWKYR